MRLTRPTRKVGLNLSHPLLRGCYAYYSLAHDTRNLVNTSSVADAVANNGASVLKPAGGRLSGLLDGTNDNFTVAAHALLGGGGTWAGWVRTDGLWGIDGDSGGTGARGTASFISRNTSTSSNDGLLIFITANGFPGYQAKTSGGTTVSSFTSSIDVRGSAWRHIALTFGIGSGAVCRLYVDGVEQGSGTNSAAFAINAAQPLYVGDSADTWWEELIGSVSDIALFSRVLSSAEIQQLARRPWQIFKTQTRTRKAVVSSGFVPAWAFGANVILGAGHA